MKIDEYFYLDPFGIIRFHLGGKILLFFISEFLVIWVAFMILSSWDIFLQTGIGKTILGLNLFFLITIFHTIVLKNRIISIYRSEITKQFANIIFFVIIFLLIYFYKLEDFTDNTGSQLEYYYNPLGMGYIFILVFMISFYIICNSHK